MTEKRVKLKGWHFYRRRAEVRVQRIHRSQKMARSGVGASAMAELRKLGELGIGPYDTVEVVKRGKFDRRYDVVVVKP